MNFIYFDTAMKGFKGKKLQSYLSLTMKEKSILYHIVKRTLAQQNKESVEVEK